MGEDEGLAIADLSGLLSLVQAGVLEIHPWGATLADPEKPDRITFDLDPDESVPFGTVVASAIEVREKLASLGLESFVKTTGGKGLHVVVPLAPAAGWDEVKSFAEAFATGLARDFPDRYTANMAKRARSGRIFLDYLRNTRGATAIAAYSTRARAGAPVSVPVTWEELPSLRAGSQYRVDNAIGQARLFASRPLGCDLPQPADAASAVRQRRAEARPPQVTLSPGCTKLIHKVAFFRRNERSGRL